jgi:hypothetical protein
LFVPFCITFSLCFCLGLSYYCAILVLYNHYQVLTELHLIVSSNISYTKTYSKLSFVPFCITSSLCLSHGLDYYCTFLVFIASIRHCLHWIKMYHWNIWYHYNTYSNFPFVPFCITSSLCLSHGLDYYCTVLVLYCKFWVLSVCHLIYYRKYIIPKLKHLEPQFPVFTLSPPLFSSHKVLTINVQFRYCTVNIGYCLHCIWIYQKNNLYQNLNT